ncbi:MAG: single-stranded-DNA-specific exonuclease RecJ [Steroidobacteraceae bacterium]
MTISEIRRRHAGSPFESADLHPVLRRVYAARGIVSSELDLSLERLLPVASLPGVEAAARLLAAHRRQGRIVVIGDFDADGATSSALVVRALRAMRFNHVEFLVPDRFRFGYGLTPEIVGEAASRQPSLLVTVDNGMSSIEGVECARERGIAVLVTDHHLPGRELPRADAIVNPNLAGSTFGSRNLAGVGVAFYVMAALARELGERVFRIADLLDLVALGTVADVVPLDRNNRILVAQGLRRIRAGRCVAGILALVDASGRSVARLTAADLGFAVAPRLNAAGRLTDMSVGIACLLADEPGTAAALAAQLSRLNDERRAIELRMQAEAVRIAAGQRLDASGVESPGLCLFEADWHQGVVGLVAGRIKERVNRPVIAFARCLDGTLRGSARSVAGINIRDTLESIAVRHPGMILKFGGHAMAAGLNLRESALQVFRAAFCAEVAARAGADAFTGIVYSDGELFGDELSVETARALRNAGPWGQGFPEPIFDGEFTVLDARVVGGKHLKLQLAPCTQAAPASGIDAIAFGGADVMADAGSMARGRRLHVAYRLEVDQYRGGESAQLNCQHLMRA